MNKCLICNDDFTLGDVYGICISCDEWMTRAYCNFNQMTGTGFSCRNSPGKYTFRYICDNAGVRQCIKDNIKELRRLRKLELLS